MWKKLQAVYGIWIWYLLTREHNFKLDLYSTINILLYYKLIYFLRFSVDKGHQLGAHHLCIQYAFNVATIFILGIQSDNDRKCLRKACDSVVKGFGAWRIYLPGTSYYNACQVYLHKFWIPNLYISKYIKYVQKYVVSLIMIITISFRTIIR